MKTVIGFLALVSAVTIQAATSTFTVIAPDQGDSPAGWPATFAAAIRARQLDRGDTGTVLVLDAGDTGESVLDDLKTATSIHFIGHQGGAGVLGRLAALIPETRIDQFTVIDPPAAMEIPANVVFADDYYQTQAATKGVALDGAYNLRLVFLNQQGASEVASLLTWYETTIHPGPVRGYFYTDCNHGVRPVKGFGARRVGRPSFTYIYDPKASLLTERFAGGASGVYHLEASFDPAFSATTVGNGTITLDGRPFEVEVKDFDAAQYPRIFFRLRSAAGLVGN